MTPHPIDLAYADINALGGMVEPGDEIGRERMALLDTVILILRHHGAMDPALRPAADEADDLRAASVQADLARRHQRLLQAAE